MRNSENRLTRCQNPLVTVAGGTLRNMEPARILIADDHPVMRRGVKSLLAAHKGWKVCGEASTGAEAVEKTALLKPDIVIIDISMPEMNGIEATRQIRANDPQVRILALTMHNSELMFREAMEAGTQAYVLKSDVDTRLIDALEALCEDRVFLSPSISQAIVESFAGKRTAEDSKVLTPRQREVVRLLARGKSNKEVASVLGISTRTAETHRYHIMNRLHVQTFSDLVLYAVRNHLIEM